MSLTRRLFVQGSVFLAAGGALAACSDSDDTADKSQTPPRGYDSEPRPLPIPPLLEGEKDGDTRVFKLTAQDGHSEILPGAPETRTWGFNGPYLGPTLRAHKGEKVRAEITNDLIEMTTVHWHGMKLPAYSDGGPHSPIQVGETWKPTWTIAQPAATTWYHPHPHMATETHAYRGLAGMFILDDDVSDGLELPHEYGVDDIPVVLVDAKFTDDNQLDHSVDSTLGLLGTTPVVNGITNAKFEATTRRVRLRILNAASMRFYTLTMHNGTPLRVIATDAGLLPEPLTVDEAFIGPGQRLEVLVDLKPGEEHILQSVARADNFGVPDDEYSSDFGFGDNFDLLRIIGPAADTPDAPALPTELDPAALEVPSEEGLTEREFVLNTFMINGESMDMARVDVVIDHDEPEIWTVTNENDDWPHNFHIHDARFKVLGVDVAQASTTVTVRPKPEAGWRDTVNLPPKTTVRLLVEFGHYPDPTIPYMYHCHMLLHEDQGMMGQFVIVDKGEKPDVRVQAAALYFEQKAHSNHGGQVIDASRSPYATPTQGA
ncbi:multicopper oxidase domain-containing protein [Corynebacterium phoceense]|uniref:multicopper oxidase family protein n=1 Tax=Corynebacterium phoceense TaxID=1686286 RepID=UPI00211CA39C|nr:multicopper oxidase domain-containing protein [Corynebacterium phoceense]MCQ9333307.1 multicopper oxidase domain-containing protein [Corynebacterium phoceense]MCQ9337477.1 multicopper oxidase domain-containing protein [Corynebacterium phoceense]